MKFNFSLFDVLLSKYTMILVQYVPLGYS